MSESAKLAFKTSESKSENSASQTKKISFAPSVNSPIDQIFFFQRTVGNQAVERLLKSGFIQAKLALGQPGDIYEQEADRVAEQVMRMPDPSTAWRKGVSKDNKFPRIQRMCTECEEELQGQSQRVHIQRMCKECEEGLFNSVGAASSRDRSHQDGAPTLSFMEIGNRDSKLQRQPMEEEEEILQVKEVSSSTPEVGSETESQINNIRGGGQPLSDSVRAFFEPRFGRDFSYVRVHTDSQASGSANAVNALAYTVGTDIVFGAGRYVPETTEGKRLLAHELTHVVQQGNEKSVIRRKIQFDSPNYIRENPIGRILSEQPVGLTTPTVDSSQPVDFKQAGELIFKALEPKETTYEPSTKECTFKDFDVKVSANVIIPTEPEGKKWTMNLPGSGIKGIAACHKKKNVPVVMTGKPSSEAAGKWIEKNEQEHVDDLKKLYDKYLEPHFKWVLSLKGKGDDTKKCQESLMSELGNKDALVVRDFLKNWAESIRKRDEGGKHSLRNDIKDKDSCSRVEIESSKK